MLFYKLVLLDIPNCFDLHQNNFIYKPNLLYFLGVTTNGAHKFTQGVVFQT